MQIYAGRHEKSEEKPETNSTPSSTREIPAKNQRDARKGKNKGRKSDPSLTAEVNQREVSKRTLNSFQERRVRKKKAAAGGCVKKGN